MAGAWWTPVAFWLLAGGFFVFYWEQGALRGLLLLACAGLAAWCLGRPPGRPGASSASTRDRRQRWLERTVVLLVLIHAVFCAMKIAHLVHLSDIAGTTLAAIRGVTQGENPYTAHFDVAAIEAAGPRYGGYKYLPVMPLVYAPLALTLGERGMLLTNLALDLATAAMIWAGARRDAGRGAGPLAAALFLSLPLMLSALYAKGVTDLVPVAFGLAGMLATRNRPALAGLLCGLSIASKLLPGLAMLPAGVPHRGRLRFALGLGVGLVPVGLAFLSAPQGFVDNIVRFNAVRPIDSTSWMHGLPPVLTGISRAGLAVAWVALAVLALRFAERVATRAAFAAVLVVVVMLAGPGLRQNYNLWWIALLCIPVATTAGRRQAGSGAGRPSEASGARL